VDFQYIARFGPIGADADVMHAFWARTLGLPFEELAPGYFHAPTLGGAKHFALWPLHQAAEATFGCPEWPTDRPVPQAWIELEVSSPEAVAATATQLRDAGQEILVEAHEESWGQTTARLLSPEGILVGVSYMPTFHADEAPAT
jgi:catechol 2,3-dioxygenase-like lactoylglutathione lyase family enzyme